MLTAHETVKTAWSNFKAYPRLRQLILFSFLALLPSLFLTLYTQNQGAYADTVMHDGLVNLLNGLASIPAYIIYFLMGMSITHYVCTGWTFNSFFEFIRPPSSRWRLFWKSFTLYFVLFIGFVIIASLIGYVMVTLPMMGKITIGTILGLILIVGIIFIFTKLVLVSPYFIMNDDAPLLSPIKFSEGYFWYLTKILGWMFLYAILFIILIAILFAIVGLTASVIGTIGLVIVTCMSFVFQILAALIAMFIYSETYKQIAENKS